MKGRVASVGAGAALIMFAVVSGCDVYESTRLLGKLEHVEPDSGTPYIERCGNGKLDEGEQCDIGIEAGEPHACPSDCVSEDPCSLQAKAGERCQSTCAVLRVERAIHEDGCCPTGFGPAQDSDCGVCGDEILGPTETCEPAASCVTKEECSSIAGCLRGTLSGNPETCTSACPLTLIVTCQNSDGCCPVGCNSGNDNDCSATCGNGILEAQNQETCEPASTDHPCPTTCDDTVACTEDVSSGSAAQCNLICLHRPITSPAPDDGCCPAGANATTDNDCLPVCGNNVQEGGEACDPCPSSCSDGNVCTVDMLSGSGCNVQCNHTAITSPSGGDGCCPAGANAVNDHDCDPVCGNGVVESGEECDGSGRCNGSCVLVLPSSLVHRYSFSGTGTTATDSVGTAHGTVVGTTLSGNGVLSIAAGTTNQYLDLPNGIVRGRTDVTIEVWTTWLGGSTGHRVFDFGMNSAGEGLNSGEGTHYFYLNPGNSQSTLAFGANFASAVLDYEVADHQVWVTPTLSIGNRRHLVVTFRDPGASSTKTATLYVDGAQVGTVSVSVSSSGTNNRLSNLDDRNAWIGRSNYSNATYAGSFDEVRIYNVALSASAVSASFNAGPNP